MICPECKSTHLEILRSLELPPDADNDETTLQTLRCGECGCQALGLYEESRHGRLDSAAWRHTGYLVSPEDFQAVSQAIESCPRPKDTRCQCAAHQGFGRHEGGKWDGLRQSNVNILGVFRVRL